MTNTRFVIPLISLAFAISFLVIGTLAYPAAAQNPPHEAPLDAPSTDDGRADDPISALTEGNRMFRDGLIEEAAAAYRRGFDPEAPHPTLVYNLGTALHHLDRLPEAILWYRRGVGSDDPWLDENLWLARRTLGSQTLPATGITSLISRQAKWLRIAAVALAWVAFGLLVIGAPRRIPALTLFFVAGLLYATAAGSTRLGPEAAVLLEDCTTSAGDLPAGTEVWVKRQPDGDWRITAHSDEAICPATAVEPVAPTSR